ncbi:MAG: hypothetical protein LBQ79_01305 [Deltaproteobacteria bacterium]|nr:hypothetical protein [Deltaproteobacteria bacterium]
MRKSLFVITLLACSFLLPSWALADLRGSFFCCSKPALSSPASGLMTSRSGHHAAHGVPASPAGRESGHHAAHSIPATPEDRESGQHADHESAALPDAHAGHPGAEHAAAQPSGDPAADQGNDQAGDAQPDHPFCGLLSCAQVTAAGVPETYPQLSYTLETSAFTPFSSPLPALPAQTLFRPPRA